MEKIFVLVTVEPKSLESVYSALCAIDDVDKVDMVTGPFDLILQIEGEFITDALSVVVRKVRRLEGVISTETLVVVSV